VSTLNSVVAIYDTHVQAEEAVKELQVAGVDMKTLSIAAKDTHTDEHVVGYYNAGDRMKHWGKIGAFWGGFWDCSLGPRCLQYQDWVRCSWLDHSWHGSWQVLRARLLLAV